MMTSKKYLYLTLALLGAGSSFGQITYVDAKEGSSGNTFLTGASPDNTDWIDLVNNFPGINDTVWSRRFGGTPGWTQHNNGDVIQALVTNAESDSLGEITTQITGLADGTYDVWVFFWEQIVSDTQNWMIDAGLTSGSLTSYSSPLGPVDGTDSTTPVNADTLTFTHAPSVVGVDGRQNMFGVKLGQVSVQNGSSIDVYVDKLIGNGSNNRTIFDGVGYELAAPTDGGPEITSLVPLADDVWEVQLSGQSDTGYVIRSSSTLEFDSGFIVEDLDQASPDDAGEVSGENKSVITTDASGQAKVLVTLGQAKGFIRTEQAP